MKSLYRLFTAFLFTVLMFAAQSCGDSAPTSEIALTDIAVLRSSGEGETVFAVIDQGKVHALTARGQINSDLVRPGDAFMVKFIPSGTDRADITGYSPMSNLKTIVADSPDSIAGWDATPVRLLSYTVIDRHLIFHAGLPYSQEKRAIRLVVMQSNDDVADAYLYQKLDSDTPTFVRDYYFSFDLSAGSLSGISRLKLHVNNSNLPVDLIEIPLNQ